MITAAEFIGTTINSHSDLLQNPKVIFALWGAKKIDFLKEFEDCIPASITPLTINAYAEYPRSFQKGFFAYNEWPSSRQEDTAAVNSSIKANFDKIYQPINKSFANRAFNERISITDNSFRPEVEWLIPKASPISTLLSDLRDLLKEQGNEENEDEYGALRPTAYAFKMALNFIIVASLQLKDGYPFGCASTDSEGGIRIEWFKTTGEIRLVIPASQNEAPYIYYEFDEKYGVDRQANADKLARWINRLNNI